MHQIWAEQSSIIALPDAQRGMVSKITPNFTLLEVIRSGENADHRAGADVIRLTSRDAQCSNSDSNVVDQQAAAGSCCLT